MRAVLVREAHVVEDDRFLDVLDAGERDRAMRRQDRVAFVHAHALQRLTIADQLGVEPTSLVFERRCATCGSDRHGKPGIAGHPEWSYSLSYTTHLVVLALSQAGEVGVDVESLQEADFSGFDEVTLAPEEVVGFAAYAGDDLAGARATVWARKEAVLKATGYGLVVDPTEVVVTSPGDAPELVDWRATQAAPDAVAIRDLDLRERTHRGAVAVLADPPVGVRMLP